MKVHFACIGIKGDWAFARKAACQMFLNALNAFE